MTAFWKDPALVKMYMSCRMPEIALHPYRRWTVSNFSYLGMPALLVCPSLQLDWPAIALWAYHFGLTPALLLLLSGFKTKTSFGFPSPNYVHEACFLDVS